MGDGRWATSGCIFAAEMGGRVLGQVRWILDVRMDGMLLLVPCFQGAKGWWCTGTLWLVWR